MKNNKTKSRRSFLKQCAALNVLGYTSGLSALGSLSLTSQMAYAQTSRPSGYKAIVCIYQTGGNDLNMLVPTDDDSFSQYQEVRQSLALDRDEFVPISSNGKSFGLHPSCAIENENFPAASGGLKKLYDQGNLAFIANTGALLEPTTVDQFLNQTVEVPPSIGNHLIQKDFVRAGSFVNGQLTTGWAGRIADLYGVNTGDVPINGTVLGDNIWQRGENSSTYSFTGSGVRQLYGYREAEKAGAAEGARRSALYRVNNLSRNHEHLFVREYGRILSNSLSLSDALREGANSNPSLQTQFPSGTVSQRLKSIAELINNRAPLGMDQQIFYVDSPGWDMHSDLFFRHGPNLEDFSAGVAAFYEALKEMGLENDVITFTNGDFGRTLDPNSTGSDHAWGGNQMIIGGRVDGGQVFGDYPMFVNGDGETQYRDFRGVLVPSIATDQVSSTIAKWFGGFSDATLNDIFPSVRNFDTNDLGLIV